jgi:Tfp pilus tip-associated adhesin PilY1
MRYHKSDKLFPWILVAAMLFFLPLPAAAVSNIFETRVSDVGQDAEESEAGVVSINEYVLDLGGPGRRVGLRFSNVQIPRYAVITRAYIEFTAAAGDSGNITLQIEVENSDNPIPWLPVAYDLSSRTTSTTNVNWNVTYDWLNEGQTHQSEELKALVNGIVSRSGWRSGNAMSFILSSPHTTGRQVKSADKSLAEAAKLHIEYAANMIEVPIQASSDDMFHNAGATSGRTYDYDYVRIGSTATTTEWYSGFRFTDVDIPQGAVINFANVKFFAYGDYPTAQTGTAVIRGEARTNPPTFSTLDQNIDAVARRARSATVPKTNASVTWTSFPAWAHNQPCNSPDITPIIQEIIGQAGWDTSFKSLVLLIGPNGLNPHRAVYSVNTYPELAPVLHIEWGAGTGGGTGGGDTGGGGTGVAVMSPSTTDIGRSVFQGALVQAFPFDMINSGQATLNYTRTVTYNSGSGWMSLSPAAATGSVAPGEKQTFTVDFNTAGLTPGTYEAKITFTDPAASNSPQEIRVSLSILAQAANTCNEAPLYTKSVSSPAVMVLLDNSGSMGWGVDLVDPKDTTGRTPELKEVVQELVNQDAWLSGSAAVFFVEHVSGTGRRHARAFDGNSAAAPLLRVEYTANGSPAMIETRVAQSADDGYGNFNYYNFYTWDTNILMAEPGVGSGAGLRFANLTIPKNAAITRAYIEFVPTLTQSDPLRVRISAEANSNPPSFSYGIMEMQVRQKTAASVTWDVPAWTGVTVETRMNVAKTVIGELFKDPNIAWGFGKWDGQAPYQQAADGSWTLIDVGCRPNLADQQTKLQAALAAATPGAGTPFSPSLLAAKLYFEGKKKDDNTAVAGYEDGQFYAPAECQPKFLIEVTDGQGNIESTPENVRTRAEDLANAGVSSVGIGFGLQPVDAEQLYVLADVANTRGKASTSDQLYPMHQEDKTGKAQPYMTYNKDQLVEAFKSIMSNVKGVVFYGSAPAATTSVDLGNSVLVSSFTSGTWGGELQAISKASNGSWTSSIWKATDNFPVSRSVWTVDGSNNMTAYTDSTLSGDNWLCKKLGDIIHSTPVVVGPPPFYYPFDSYAIFKRDRTLVNKRESLAYVGANDGLLHAFNLKDGKEKWAFLPPNLHAKLNLAANGGEYDMCSAAYCHQYLLDGNPQVADVYAKFGGVDKWRTLLVVGQRGGGTAYSALDVTSGQSPDPSNSDPAKLLWQFTDAELGESWADPAIERVADATGQTGAAAWGVFFGSGYHENDNLQANKEAYLYGLQANTGAGLWSDNNGAFNKVKLLADTWAIGYCNATGGNFVAGETVTGRSSKASAKIAAVSGACPGTLQFNNSSAMNFQVGEWLDGNLGHSAPVTVGASMTVSVQKNNALGSPLVVNFSANDHIEDALYIGDLYGNMFRVDTIGKGQTPAVSRLFKFNPYPTSPDVNPIRAKASNAYGKNAGEMWIYFGTGRYETQADSGSATQQYFFGLKDSPTPRATPYTVSDLKPLEARFTTATVNGSTVKVRTISGTNAGGDPWALKLFAKQADWGGPATASGSERVFTKPLVVGGIVFFTTFIPDATTCGGSGDTWVFALDYKTGLPPASPVFDLDGDKKFTDKDKVEINGSKVVPVGLYVGRGQGSHPVLFKDTLFVTTSTPQLQVGDANAGGTVTGLNAMMVNIPQKKIKLESWRHN